jgi:predicted RNA binding protein YcfA (HicA-like mRNA interferase family)
MSNILKVSLQEAIRSLHNKGWASDGDEGASAFQKGEAFLHANPPAIDSGN